MASLLIAESDSFSREALSLLTKEFDRVELMDLDREELLSNVAEFDYLWVRLRNSIDQEIISTATELKGIISATTGLNHIDTAFANNQGIAVLSLKGETEFLRTIRATAELTIGLIISLIRGIPWSFDSVRTGEWNRDLFRGRELYGNTVGLIGFGRLGSIVAEILSSFEATVIAYDPAIPLKSYPQGIRGFSSPEEVFSQADILSLHASFSEGSRSFIDKRLLSMMKPTSFFINTSRGELLDESALLNTLMGKRIAGAALDVLANETSLTPQKSPLIQYAMSHGNLLITPHIGGCTFDSMVNTELFMARKLLRFYYEGAH